MKILVGTLSEKKILSIKKALKIFDINDYDLTAKKVSSDVSENPLNEETLKGALNRNRNLLKLNIPYDMCISIEAGFTKENDNYYLDTYCNILYKGKEYIGMSPRLKINKIIYDYVSSGNMLHLLVQKLQKTVTDEGVIGFLSDGKLKRSEVEVGAVVDALNKVYNKEKLDYIKDYDGYINNKNYEILNKAIMQSGDENV